MVKKKTKKDFLEKTEALLKIKLKSKKLKSKKILKPSQMTMTIKKQEIESYKPIYMKDILEQEKRSMFFD